MKINDHQVSVKLLERIGVEANVQNIQKSYLLSGKEVELNAHQLFGKLLERVVVRISIGAVAV